MAALSYPRGPYTCIYYIPGCLTLTQVLSTGTHLQTHIQTHLRAHTHTHTPTCAAPKATQLCTGRERDLTYWARHGSRSVAVATG